MDLQGYSKYLPLKRLPRTGWVRDGVKNPESVAAHVWGVVALVLELQPTLAPQVDLLRALKMAIHHDTPEIIAGDVTPHDGISTDEKLRLERAGAQKILGPADLEMWEELEAGMSETAKFVKAMDRLDMALQAIEYLKHGELTREHAQAYIDYSKKSWEKLGYPQLVKEIDRLI